MFHKKYPDIIHEGEVQFDAAINNIISSKKIANSKLYLLKGSTDKSEECVSI